MSERLLTLTRVMNNMVMKHWCYLVVKDLMPPPPKGVKNVLREIFKKNREASREQTPISRTIRIKKLRHFQLLQHLTEREEDPKK